jgi:hypothetical protein
MAESSFALGAGFAAAEEGLAAPVAEAEPAED